MRSSQILAILFSLLAFISCKKEDKEKVTIPVVGTKEISPLTPTSVIGGGKIINNGGMPILAKGVCWDTLACPTIDDEMTNDGTGDGEFTSLIEGLKPGKWYYVMAYATNSEGTGYGNEVTFFTPPLTPKITTSEISSISSTSATGGISVEVGEGIKILYKGICFSKTPNPTIDGQYLYIQYADETGRFSGNMTSLLPHTRYYVRAFIIFQILFSDEYYFVMYGNEVSFITASVLPAVKTGLANSVLATTANLEGEVLDNGGDPIIRRGICLDTINNPDLDDQIFYADGELGFFSIKISELKPNTWYYFRAFAENDIGTAYGTEEGFLTSTGSVTDISGNIYATVKIGTQIWIRENLKTTMYNDGTNIPQVIDEAAWLYSETPAYCWYNNLENTTYGILYNWYCVNTGKLCPIGWHVPSQEEWITLRNYLSPNPGRKLRESTTTHWINNEEMTNNSSGFTALPGGARYPHFNKLGENGYWWSSLEFDLGPTWAKVQIISGTIYYIIENSPTPKQNGCSVRCIKD